MTGYKNNNSLTHSIEEILVGDDNNLLCVLYTCIYIARIACPRPEGQLVWSLSETVFSQFISFSFKIKYYNPPKWLG